MGEHGRQASAALQHRKARGAVAAPRQLNVPAVLCALEVADGKRLAGRWPDLERKADGVQASHAQRVERRAAAKGARVLNDKVEADRVGGRGRVVKVQVADAIRRQVAARLHRDVKGALELRRGRQRQGALTVEKRKGLLGAIWQPI